MATNVTSFVHSEPTLGRIAGNRWIQLVCGIVAMILLSNYQYAFTLFTPGMKLSFPGVSLRENCRCILCFHFV